MRRVVAWGLALALIVALMGCGFVRWPLTAIRVGDSLNAAFGASPRLHWRAPRAASFAALPWPNVWIADARLDDLHGVNLVAAPGARLDLSLIGLLRGRFIPKGAVLASPAIALDIDRPPFAGTAGGSAGPAGAARAFAPLTSLSLSNGVLRLVSARRGLDVQIDKVRGRLDGLTIGGRLSFSLSAMWRGTPFAFIGALADPEAAAKGGSPLAFGLDSPLVKLAFGGAVALGDKPGADGDLTASVPSIAALAALFHAEPPPVLAAGDLTVAGKVEAGPDGLTLGEARLTSAGQTLEGALALGGAGGRPAVSGTLAADTLALEPLLGSPRRLLDPSGAWSAKPFAFAPPRGFDLDLRVSAAHLDAYGLMLSGAAASASVTDGEFDLNLIEAAAYGGRIEGETSLVRVGRDLKMSATADLADADLGAACASFGGPLATGRGGAKIAVEAAGASPAAMIAGLAGTASIEAEDGSVLGVNLEEALRRSRRRPIDAWRDMRLGGTAYDKLEVSLTLADGRARVERGAMASRAVTARLDGLIDLAAQNWALRLAAAQTDAAGEELQDAAHLTLDIRGPWSAPKVRAGGATGTDARAPSR